MKGAKSAGTMCRACYRVGLFVTEHGMAEHQLTTPRIFPVRRRLNLAAWLYLLFMLAYLLVRTAFGDGIWQLALINNFALLLFVPLPLLLLAALLARSRRALLTLLPVLAWAGVWFGPRFIPKAAPPESGPTLRVMTNNIWHLNPTPEKVAEVIDAEKPDVVFLQEVQLSTQGAGLSPLDTAYPYQSQLLDQMRLYLYTAHNLTYSRYPFVSSEAVSVGGPEMPLIYRDVIEVNGARVALYNVHLVAPDTATTRLPGSRNYLVRTAAAFDDTERNQQLDALLALLASESLPYIVAGDFNTSDTSVIYGRIVSRMHDSFIEGGLGYGGTWPIARALGWSRFIPAMIRMDYIWHSDGLRTVRAWQGDVTGSDHRPLLADFVVGK
jgi:endonuclease/exonuclease/phosphatase (EEP) superfamily protein YafD